MGVSKSPESIILPKDRGLSQKLKQILTGVNAQGRAAKSPLKFSAFRWYKVHKVQVIMLSPREEEASIPVEEFSKIGKLQITLLKSVREQNLPIKISFIANAAASKMNHHSLNPVNYDNIATQLIEEPFFDRQFMIINNPILETGLKSGVFILSQIEPAYKDRFYVFDNLNDTIHKLSNLYPQITLPDIPG